MTTIVWDSLTKSKNLLYNNQSGIITFPYIGIYEIAIGFTEEDLSATRAWTAFRVHGIRDDSDVGLSRGIVVPGTSAGSEYWDYNPVFFAEINDLTEFYQIQIGRDAHSLTFGSNNSPADIVGTVPPFMQCTIKYLGTAD